MNLVECLRKIPFNVNPAQFLTKVHAKMTKKTMTIPNTMNYVDEGRLFGEAKIVTTKPISAMVPIITATLFIIVGQH